MFALKVVSKWTNEIIAFRRYETEEKAYNAARKYRSDFYSRVYVYSLNSYI